MREKEEKEKEKSNSCKLIEETNLQFTAVVNDNLGAGAASLGTILLNGINNVQTLSDLAKNGVLAIEPSGLDSADEELGSVSVGSSVGHGEDTGASVLEGKVLISELLTIDGLATGTVAASKVSTLKHELGNDTVESATLVAKALFASAKSTEVLGSLGNNILSQLHNDTAKRAAVGRDIKENLGVRHVL